MSAYYTFVCSLPYLSFDSEPPMPPEDFLARASFYLTEEELADLGKPGRGSEVGAAWERWERSFRTAVAAVRAGRTGKEFQPDKTDLELMDSQVRQTVSELYKTEAPMRIERGLDALRFAKLDELASGHYFDYAVIFCYFQKLLILWRWKNLDVSGGRKVMEDCCAVKQNT